MMEVHRYQLFVRGAYSKSALRGAGLRSGALLRFKFGDGVIGHADLFPWPELGDAVLTDLLHELAQAVKGLRSSVGSNLGDDNLVDLRGRLQMLANSNQRFLLLPRTVDALDAEADALREQRPLVGGSVQNHFTALSALQLAPADILDARRGGFPAIKVKIAGILEEAKALGRLQSHWDLPLRLDANENSTPESLRVFLDALPIRLRDSIEFIEDPFPFSLKGWSAFHAETGIPIAIDRPVMGMVRDQRGVERSLGEVFSEKAAQVYVHKPAWLRDETAIAATKASVPIIVTSALGHPVGNLWAASVASRLAPDSVHGCLTHTVYRDDEISNSLIASKQIRGSRIFGLGAGLGLPAKSLNRIKWEKLA
jgi:O-succinylbenzoate synthase